MEGNLYQNGADPPVFDKNPVVLKSVKPPFRLVENNTVLEWSVDRAWLDTQDRNVVTAKRLGKTAVAGLPYDRPDGTPVRVDRDFLGISRNTDNTMPGPVESPDSGRLNLSKLLR
jgi:hypothetical protein